MQRYSVSGESMIDRTACVGIVTGEDGSGSVATYYCRTRMDGSMARNTPRGNATEG